MRICLYSNYFLPIVGGVQSASLALATAWAGLGHDVLVVSDTPASEGYDRDRPFRVTRQAPRAAWKQILADRDILVSNGHSLRYIRQWRAAGVPFGWIHAMALLMPARVGLRTRLAIRARRWSTRLASFNICVSEAVKRNMGNRKAVILPNLVSPIFRPMPEVTAGTRYLYFGRMWMPKGIDTLLEAMHACRGNGRPIDADFYGDGSDREEAVALARRLDLGERVCFHGSVSGEDLVRVINNAKAVIVPSRCQEAFGLAAAEAMACGKCVIGARDGGLAEVLADAALTFEPGNARQLAEHLQAVERDASLLATYGEKGLRRAAVFSQATVAQQYIDFFASVIARQRR